MYDGINITDHKLYCDTCLAYIFRDRFDLDLSHFVFFYIFLSQLVVPKVEVVLPDSYTSRIASGRVLHTTTSYRYSCKLLCRQVCKIGLL